MQLGVIGLGTMGANLARNAARNGAEVIVFNRTTSKTDEFMSKFASEGKFVAAHTIHDFLKAFAGQRAILIMVKAGPPVDDVINELINGESPSHSNQSFSSNQQPETNNQKLAAGDILIDGGNSFYHDSERREKALTAKGFQYLGMGVSGGEEGALLGPSMMPGGSEDAFNALKPLLIKMAASDGTAKGKCVSFIGKGGAGHFVKMVHNGIEYGDMQLIAESYQLLKTACGLNNEQIGNIFTQWNEGKELQSFLIEITATVFKKKDADTGKNLVDMILDKAGQKGTGKWTTQSALDLGVALPTITAAVDARILSAHKDERVSASSVIGELAVKSAKLQPKQIAAALYVSKICSYAQGMAMIAKASKEYGWNIDISEVCRIWKGGCIIRSTLLKQFEKAFKNNPQLPNLLVDESMVKIFTRKHKIWRKVISSGVLAGIPLPAMTASISYFDSYRSANLPQNLTQAQRDFFGAHTYERTDKPGVFHTQWEEE